MYCYRFRLRTQGFPRKRNHQVPSSPHHKRNHCVYHTLLLPHRSSHDVQNSRRVWERFKLRSRGNLQAARLTQWVAQTWRSKARGRQLNTITKKGFVSKQRRHPKAYSSPQADAQVQQSPSVSLLAEAAVSSSFRLQGIARYLSRAAQHPRLSRYQYS